MDEKRMAAMADKVADDVTSPSVAPKSDNPALDMIDDELDKILFSIKAIEDALPGVETANADQEKAKAKIQDLFETAINPYIADVLEAFNVFEVE